MVNRMERLLEIYIKRVFITMKNTEQIQRELNRDLAVALLVFVAPLLVVQFPNILSIIRGVKF